MRDVAQSSDNSPAPSTPAQRDEHPRRREGTCGGRDEAEAVTVVTVTAARAAPGLQPDVQAQRDVAGDRGDARTDHQQER
jgi:hypothetical protein